MALCRGFRAGARVSRRMPILTSARARDRLAVGAALERLWGETMGLPDGDSKERPLRLIAELLAREGVPYALIGGVAIQLHSDASQPQPI
jgi:hypothetical protein